MTKHTLYWLTAALLCLFACSCSKDPVQPGEPPQNLAWKRTASGTDKSLWSSIGTAGDNVFAFGSDGTSRRFNGSGWTPEIIGVAGQCDFRDAWKAPSGKIYLVGGTCLLEYDGTNWSDFDPLPAGEWNYSAIWGFSDDDVFVAATPVVGIFGGRILRWDGNSWSVKQLNQTTGFNSLWGTTSLDVFAAGGIGTVVHYDGSAWSEPMNTGIDKAMWALLGFSSKDVYVFGDGGNILHYDGKDWVIQTSGVTSSLFDAWATGPNDIYAVGFEGVVLHSDGRRWSPMDSDTDMDLFGVWGSSGANVFAVGYSGTIIRYAPE